MLSCSITTEGLKNVQPFFTSISDFFCLTRCWSRPREKPCLVFSAGFRLLINTAHVKCAPLARRHAKISSEWPERARRGYICGMSYLEANVTALRRGPRSHGQVADSSDSFTSCEREVLRRRAPHRIPISPKTE